MSAGFPSFAFSFAFRVYLLPFTRTYLWWYNYPARTVLWCIIAHKNDFCERQTCPTRTTNSWTAYLVFANSHIILPSIWLVLYAAMSFRNIGRKMSGALKKVTRSSSSQSSSHRSSTPTPSYSHQDEQTESQARPSPAFASSGMRMPRRCQPTQARVGLTPGAPNWASPAMRRREQGHRR